MAFGTSQGNLLRMLLDTFYVKIGAQQYYCLPCELVHGMNNAGIQALLIQAGQEGGRTRGGITRGAHHTDSTATADQVSQET